MKNSIEIRGLHKSYGSVKAVCDLTFSVGEGQLFAFLGVNGAGKSTTIHILSGRLRKDAGEVFVDGKNVETEMEGIKRHLGVVFQSSVLDKSLSVRENLCSRAALYGIFGAEFEQRLAELAARLDFADLLKRPVGKLSGGQRRRIDIARALLHQPRILILDEPTTGLDPQTRRLLFRVVEEERQNRGMTVLLTTHYMEEAADADYVVILDGGRIAAEGTPLALKNAYAGDHLTLYGVEEAAVAALGLPYVALPGAFRVSVKSTAGVRELMNAHPALFVDFEVTKGKMDDVFLAVTGKKLGGDTV
ncbi:MAG: ABC transporter ATP-binding protein [Ruminococcaceae bacterium]|nr:ABC transporter ATP-binding protein [Oscillospiraceae bacterium]